MQEQKEQINISDILKNYIGNYVWSPIFGKGRIVAPDNNMPECIRIKSNETATIFYFDCFGHYIEPHLNRPLTVAVLLFPEENQDVSWNDWKKDKRLRKCKSEEYFYISTSDMTVKSAFDDDQECDIIRYLTGNYFLSRVDAGFKLRKIKEILQTND